MGSLIRATAMWGYPELVRELGGDPAAFLERFHIPAGAEHPEDAHRLGRRRRTRSSPLRR